MPVYLPKTNKQFFSLPEAEPKILIAEDDEDILRLYRDAISGEGFCVETATNGKDALDKVWTFQPKIILLDLDLPVITGDVFLEQLYKQQKDKSKIPHIVIFTNWQSCQSAQLVEDYNLSGYFVKLRASIYAVIDNLKKLSNDEKVNWLEVM